MSADLGNLRSAYLACVPVDFITGAVRERYVAQVLIMRLQLAQRATYADQFDFACEVIEYVKLPEPAVSDPSAAYMNHSQLQCQLTVQAGCAAVRHRPVALTIQSDRFLLDPNSEEGMAREPRSDDQVDRFVFNPAGIVFDPNDPKQGLSDVSRLTLCRGLCRVCGKWRRNPLWWLAWRPHPSLLSSPCPLSF